MKQLQHFRPKHVVFIVTLFCLLNYKVQSQIISTIAGNGTGIYNGDNIPATQAQFLPEAIATDKTGNLFISDLDDSRIRKVDRNGIITTVAGNGIRAFAGDGGLAIDASLNYNWGIALNSTLNLYIVDDGESRVRKVTADGIINTIAGIDTVNTGGYNGDSILAIDARFDHPSCIAVDSVGNIYIADQNRRIRKINIDGVITTIAGTGISGYSGDGGLAINAEIGDPIGIVADRTGNIYFTDLDNNVIRKVDKNGIISTVAGNGFLGYTGDGGLAKLATLNYPFGLAVTNDGTLFIADTYNNAVRKVDATGIITTVVGDGSAGFSGDGGLAKNAKLNLPVALAFDNDNNLLIADYGNARIRKVSAEVLAVILTTFNANFDNDRVKINWQTTNETNVAYFNVQRSTNGNSFTTIAKVAATGNGSNTKSYSYSDVGVNELSVSKLYYRLEEVDKDGKSNYSNIETIDLSKGHSLFSVSPNPAKDFINIVSSYNVGSAQVKITGINGKTLFTGKQDFVAGQQLKVSISQFPNEILFVTITSNNNTEQFKIVKQ